MTDNYKAAKYYIGQGYPVIPLYTVKDGKCSCGKEECKSPGKHPRQNIVDLSNGLKSASTDRKIIKKWWKRWPDANIGIRTGKDSFIAIDIDLPDGPNSLKAVELKYGKLPKTVKQRTGGGGVQLFFKPPDVEIKNSSGKIAPNIDVRGEGGYVLVPPSRHKSGKRYKWVRSFAETKLKKMPGWLVDLITIGEWYCAFVHYQESIPEGQRNNDLTSMGGTLRERGWELEEINECLKTVNDKRCTPPLDDSEVEKIAISVSQYKPGNKEHGGKEGNQERFLKVLLESIQPIKDKSGNYYVVIKQEQRKEVVSTQSKEFKSYCMNSYKKEFKKLISKINLDQIISHVEAKADDGKNIQEVSIRIAGYQDRVYLDLANDRREAIEITNEGWKTCLEPPVLFYRPPGMKALPNPVLGKGFKKLKQFLPKGESGNISRRLILAWLVGSLNPKGPYVVLILNGNKGSAKSTIMEFLKSLVDPSEAITRSFSKNEEDLMIYCKYNWVISFDNLSHISKQMSDALCRVSTDGGLSTRKQYTNDVEFVFKANRPIVLNGIDNFVNADDLLDRALIINLPPIEDKDRLTKADLERRFEGAKPEILGSLLDAVSSALRNKDIEIKETLPRMADYAKWVVAAEDALPWGKGRFIKDYKTHVGNNLNTLYLADHFVRAVKRLLETCEDGKWEGTSGQLLKQLKKVAPTCAMYLPKDKALSHFKKSGAALNHFKIKYDNNRSSNKRKIYIWKE